MAKANEAAASTEGQANAAPAAVETGRSIILTLDATHAALVGQEAGVTMKRTDYIRARWASRTVSRGGIAKELTTLQGKSVPYQIVFQATKGQEGGPVVTATATPVAPATEGSAA